MIEDRRAQELTHRESLRLLASVSFGRVVFSHHALPAIRPVSHLVVNDKIIIIASLGSAISIPADSQGRPFGTDGTIVAYEADSIDPGTYLGWSVVVIGRAGLVLDEAEIAGYREVLRPWAAGKMDDVIAIRAELVTGHQLVAAAAPAPDHGLEGRRWASAPRTAAGHGAGRSPAGSP
jgi:Pyridoxamine 5'-phosphate oxidase